MKIPRDLGTLPLRQREHSIANFKGGDCNLKKNLSLTVAIVMLTSIPLIGCGGNTTSPETQANSSNRMQTQSISNNYQLAPQISRRIDQLSGVRRSIVVLSGSDAYVTLDLARPISDRVTAEDFRGAQPDYTIRGAAGGSPIGTTVGPIQSHQDRSPTGNQTVTTGPSTVPSYNYTHGTSINDMNVGTVHPAGVMSAVSTPIGNAATAITGLQTETNPSQHHGYYKTDHRGRIISQTSFYGTASTSTLRQNTTQNSATSVSSSLQQSVSDLVKQSAPEVRNVHVSASPTIYGQLQSYLNHANQGQAGGTADMRNVMSRMFPTTP